MTATLPALNPKHQRFADEFLKDLNGTQAAIRAGYSKKTARVQASDLLTKPDIAAYVSEKGRRLMVKNELTVERVVQEIARIAFLDPRKLFTEDGGLKQISEWDDDTAACVAGIEVEELFAKDSSGDRQLIGHLKKIRLCSKVEGLNLAGRYLKLFGDPVAPKSPLEEAATDLLLALKDHVQQRRAKLVNA